MWYYNKDENVFEREQAYDEEGKALYVEYTDEEYDELHSCDRFHYVGYDEAKGKPVQKYIGDERARKVIRRLREKKVFPLIDRPLWLKSLTDEQLAEIEEWRQAWLDAPNTLVVPNTPSWLGVKV